MKKGEWMRQSILETAESLFFEKGYDNTSVQDVLDQLHLSKGGFYHHFPSKEAVLDAILKKRVEENLSRVKGSVEDDRLSPIDRMNRVLEGLNLLSNGDVSFAALAVRICYIDGDPVIRAHLRELMLDALRPLFDEAFRLGVANDTFFSRHPGQLSDTVLNLAADVDDRSYRALAKSQENPEYALTVLNELDAGRESVELLLGAPFASIQLFDPAKLLETYRMAAEELRRLEEGA